MWPSSGRTEDGRMFRGESRYTGEHVDSGTLHACFVRLSIAHARLAAVELGSIGALPGTVAVIAAADTDCELPVPPAALDATTSRDGLAATVLPCSAFARLDGEHAGAGEDSASVAGGRDRSGGPQQYGGDTGRHDRTGLPLHVPSSAAARGIGRVGHRAAAKAKAVRSAVRASGLGAVAHADSDRRLLSARYYFNLRVRWARGCRRAEPAAGRSPRLPHRTVCDGEAALGPPYARPAGRGVSGPAKAARNHWDQGLWRKS